MYCTHGDGKVISIERVLPDVVVRAQFHRLDGNILRARTGEQDNRYVQFLFMDPLKHIEPRHVWHLVVENDNIEVWSLEGGNSFSAFYTWKDGEASR